MNNSNSTYVSQYHQQQHSHHYYHHGSVQPVQIIQLSPQHNNNNNTSNISTNTAGNLSTSVGKSQYTVIQTIGNDNIYLRSIPLLPLLGLLLLVFLQHQPLLLVPQSRYIVRGVHQTVAVLLHLAPLVVLRFPPHLLDVLDHFVDTSDVSQICIFCFR